jgi:fructuronate reductase
MRRLNRNLLADPALAARAPAYDPQAHGVGVVHLGIGNFHRAHQALYFDELLARDGGDWRVTGVSLRSADVKRRLAPQDYLYTVVDSDQEAGRIVGALADILVAPDDPGAVIAAIADAGVAMITLTITEKGYCTVPGSSRLDLEHPDIVADFASPDRPRSALGYLVAGLERRVRTGRPLPTVVSCDNLRSNGAVLLEAIVQHASARSGALAELLARELCCPSTMVDRMVPATEAADLAFEAERLGYEDQGLVRTEPFRQWVIEDRFAGARPALEPLGVAFVDNVTPFELNKLRLLNGSHSFIAYIGMLLGFRYVHEVVAHPIAFQAVQTLMREELAPTLAEQDPAQLRAYCDTLLARFGSPFLRHALEQIGADGSQKIPVRWLDALAWRLARHEPAPLLIFGLAAWLAHFASAAGPKFADPRRAELMAIARLQDDPIKLVNAFVQIPGLLGRDFALSASFKTELAAVIAALLAGDRARATEAVLAKRLH